MKPGNLRLAGNIADRNAGSVVLAAEVEAAARDKAEGNADAVDVD